MQADYWDQARKTLDKFLVNLEKAEKKEFLLLADKWGVVSSALEGKIKALAELPIKTKDQLYRETVYKEFLVTSKTQITKYSQVANEIISDNQMIFAKAGLQSSQEII